MFLSCCSCYAATCVRCSGVVTWIAFVELNGPLGIGRRQGRQPLLRNLRRAAAIPKGLRPPAAAVRRADRANRYVGAEEPWRLVKEDRGRAATVMYTVLRAIDSIKVMISPFLPFSSQSLHEMLGYGGSLAGHLRFEEVTEGDGLSHRVLTGDYGDRVGCWEPSALRAGQKLPKPHPLFKKLDQDVVAAELVRLQESSM